MASSFLHKVASLGNLETFRAGCFQPDGKSSATACNLVLALACVHNDLNDSLLAMEMLRTVSPRGVRRRDASHGLVNGLSLHSARHMLAILRELAALAGSPDARDEKFLELVNALDRTDRQTWAILSGIGTQKTKGPLKDYLVRARNNVASHYGPKDIAEGYRDAFLAVRIERPVISRGNNIDETRFFFADAALEKRILIGNGAELFKALMIGPNSVLSGVLRALYNIVIRFLEERGGQLEPFDDDGSVPVPDLLGTQKKRRRSQNRGRKR